MIILVRRKKLIISLIVISSLVVAILGVCIWQQCLRVDDTFIDDSLKKMLQEEIQKIFDIRNQALIEEDTSTLEGLYDRNIRNGLWAYEHEVKKMKYIHQWSDKQGIEFTKATSQVIVRGGKAKGEGFTASLLVSTEYNYIYHDSIKVNNSFRIGTYHSLDIVLRDGTWIIIKEWYTDPFADSLHLDEIKSQDQRNLIMSSIPKDLSNINERRIKAVEYADQYCGAASLPEYGFKYNNKYTNFNPQGGDCANFASQMLFEGGKFTKNRTWNYERGAGSKAWVNASAFNSYMINSNRASVIAHGTYDKVLEGSYRLLPGDYVAYEKKGKVTHISVVTGIDSKGYALVNSHNSDRYRVPWDLGWSNRGVKFWIVRVHY